jgi:hypothetical protein
LYYGGTGKLESFDSAATTLDDNINGSTFKPWWQIAGGEVSKPVAPSEVVVVFPKVDGGAADADAVKVYTISPTDSSLYRVVPNTSKVIYSTAWADITDGGNPDNNTELDALADKIAEDFYLSILKRYDYTFAGLKKWQLSAYDDHVLIQFFEEQPEFDAVKRAAGEKMGAQWTRVQSSPENFGAEVQLSQDTGVVANAAAWIHFTTNETFTTGDSTFEVSVTNWAAGGENPDPDDAGLDVVNFGGLFSGDSTGMEGKASLGKDGLYHADFVECNS